MAVIMGRGQEGWARGLLIAGAAGLFMTLAGAFGTNLAPFWLRLGYWVGLMLIGGVWGRLAANLLYGRGRFDDRPIVGALLLAVIIGAPFVIVVWLLTSALFAFPLKLSNIPAFIGPVMLVSAAMTGISLMANRQPMETHEGSADDGPPRFLERLPLKLRGAEIYAVEAEDHYLRVHTDRGSDLILMRLSDAVAELEGIEGARVHRSWWVAKSALVDADRGDGRAVFTLKNGAKAPVSRTYARALREEGWY